MNAETTNTDELRPTEDIGHEFAERLDYKGYDDPILFNITCEGEETFIPSLAVELILDHEYGLVRDETFDLIGGGIDPDIDLYWGFAFDGDAVSDPTEVIQTVDEMLDGYNEPPEDVPPEVQEKWNRSTVIIEHVFGVDI